MSDEAKAEAGTGAGGRGAARDLARNLARWSRLALPVVTIALALGVGAWRGVPLAVLVLAGGALVAVIAVFWASLRTLLGETPLSGADAFAIGSPHAEEEQKRAVLRALKDLEFERSVGKISEEDYEALVAKYRAEAKRLLRLIDERSRPGRERVEALVAKRLRREGLLDGAGSGAGAADAEIVTKAARAGDDDEADGGEVADEAARRPGDTERTGDDGLVPARAEAPEKPFRRRKRRRGSAAAQTADRETGESRDERDVRETPPRVCATCGTSNDADAVFCKKCGTRQTTSSAPPPQGEGASEGAEASAETGR